MGSSDSTLIALKVAAIALNLTYWIRSWARRRHLGPLLLRMPWSRLWTFAYLLLAVLIVPVILSQGGPIYLQALDFNFYLGLPTSQLFFDRLSVYQGGIASGTTAIPWAKLEGWEWESPTLALSVWTERAAIYDLPLRGIGRWKTRQAKTAELEALLQRFAPERYRPSVADKTPEQVSHG
jgi:hypothetical protein